MVLAVATIAWIALVSWVLTAGGGFVMLAIWISRGGMRQRDSGRIRPALILGHFLLAATGLVIWIVYLATDTDALAWIAFVALVIVAALGWTMFAIWWRRRQRGVERTRPRPHSQSPASVRRRGRRRAPKQRLADRPDSPDRAG